MISITEVAERTGLRPSALRHYEEVIFAIWGNDGDPPTAVVVIASTLFWAAAVVLVTVAVLAIRRRRSSPH